MLMEEINTVIAPSDAEFWGGIAIGTVGTLAAGGLIFLIFVS